MTFELATSIFDSPRSAAMTSLKRGGNAYLDEELVEDILAKALYIEEILP